MFLMKFDYHSLYYENLIINISGIDQSKFEMHTAVKANVDLILHHRKKVRNFLAFLIFLY